MRILKMPDVPTAPQALWRQLLRKPEAATATPDLIKALNSHVNFDREVPAGAVLLIPDAADLKSSAGTAAGSEELDDFVADAETAVRAISARVAAGFKQAEADRATIVSALKTAAAKRLVDSDPQLRTLVESVEAQFKADQQRAKDIQSELGVMQKQAPAEFKRLREMLAK